MSETPGEPIIDVERLVKELRTRVARARAAGAYGDDLSVVQLDLLPPMQGGDGGIVEGFDLAGSHPRIRLRPELGFSAKPVIGPFITLVKKFILRLLFYVLDDLAQQTDAAVRRLETALAAETAARSGEGAALEARSTAVDERVAAEVAAREGVQRDVKSLAERIAASAGHLEQLQLGSRLARLERARRSTPASAGQATAAPPPDARPIPSLDYETFEARFRPEESLRERQQSYVDLLRAQKRVVDLGCGRGELVALLNGAGVSAYGVEIDPDFVELLREKGVEVVAEDAVAHLAGLEAGAVDSVVGSHLVEHLPPASAVQLVLLAAEKLADGGILILETPNPESVLAGSVNFHRDLTHVRPIHPDTLAFLCESAGFSDVEVRRLSPVPQDERLPAPAPDERLTEIVERLNELLYGYQDYAVIARKQS
jgi:O-antigen chain-terminating methyltransferase